MRSSHALFVGLAVAMLALPTDARTSKTGTIAGAVSGLKPGRDNVVVFLEGARARPDRALVHSIGQAGLVFRPSRLLVSTGDAVDFPNDDNVSHNVFSVSRAKTFDLGLYNPGVTKRVEFDKPGLVDLFCSIHENMHALVVVVPSRYYVAVDSKGRYQLDEVPPGDYEVVVWNKGREVSRTKASSSAGSITRLDIAARR